MLYSEPGSSSASTGAAGRSGAAVASGRLDISVSPWGGAGVPTAHGQEAQSH